MTHGVLLIIKDWEDDYRDMLEPFCELDLSQEEMALDHRAVFKAEILASDIKEAFKKHNIKQRKKIDGQIMYVYDRIEDFINDYHGYVLNKEKDAYGYYYNPNAKWDWFELGGRWSGMIKLKEGKRGLKGKKSFMIEGDPYKNGGVDMARVRNIDEKWLKKTVFLAVLDSKGWYEASLSGYFGCSIPNGYCCIPDEIKKKTIDKHINNECWTETHKINIMTLTNKYYKLEEDKYIKIKKEEDDIRSVTFFTKLHWDQNFYNRFLKDLDPEKILCVIDYHN